MTMTFQHDDLPLALYSAAQVRDLDARLIAAGTPGFELMQRAAHAAWRALRRRWPEAAALTVLAGHGNNAGDGYLIAALAQRAGWRVRVLAVAAPQRLAGDAAQAHAAALATGVVVEPWSECAVLEGVVVDALLGTGLAGAVRELRRPSAWPTPPTCRCWRWIFPSGERRHRCGIGEAIRADLTVTFIGLKIGLFTGEAPARVGELVFDELGSDAVVLQGLQPGPTVWHEMPCRVWQRGRGPRTRAVRPPVGGRRRHRHGRGRATGRGKRPALRRRAGLGGDPRRTCAGVAEPLSRGHGPWRGVGEPCCPCERASVLMLGPGLGQRAWGVAC